MDSSELPRNSKLFAIGGDGEVASSVVLPFLRWGEPRVTQDVDLALLAGFGSEDSFIAPLLAAYTPRIANAAEFARQHRTVLLQAPAGAGIDVSLAGSPFEERMIDRATPFEFEPGIAIRTCSAEDLVVLKLFAYRALDIRDAESVVLRKKREIDWGYISDQLRPLAEIKGEPAILETLARLKVL